MLIYDIYELRHLIKFVLGHLLKKSCPLVLYVNSIFLSVRNASSEHK
jgi:hypothetical protein